jgi:hypothetical protein
MSENTDLVEIPTDPEGREYDGTAMARLPIRHRRFVISMLQQGVNPKAAAKAAADCGYVPSYGYMLMRDERILAALREETTKRLAGAALMGINVMLKIAQDDTHPKQYNAAKDLAAINGYTAEQRITVEHVDKQGLEVISQIRQIAEQMGVDPKLLLEHAGVVDAEFEDVPPARVDDSDW